jgi:hypothetical protein
MLQSLRASLVVLIPFLVAAAPPQGGGIGFTDLLEEMADLERLARLPQPAYTTFQLSSSDRRSSVPEAPGWYENADGFGREPVPGFAKVLREPGEDGVGLYLLADEPGPGVIVRGWSAAMGGTLRVVLDGADDPLYEGPAYDFLADRTRVFGERLGLELDLGDAFRQQDCDYLPIPFARSLRVTWEGKLDELHFYQLEVRRYGADVAVRTFDVARDLADGSALVEVARRLTQPAGLEASERHDLSATLEPDATWEWSTEGGAGSRAIVELSVRLQAEDLDAALRGTLLRIAFDGASRPQVEAPVGDFSGTGTGVHPFDSLPMAMAPDGTVTCRFVMPFARDARLTLWNASPMSVEAQVGVGLIPWEWDERSLHFRAKWRFDPDLDMRFGGFDLPFTVTLGTGRLVGVASLISNPASVPHPYGSWWGEGDEKVFVDGGVPSFLGTGSEDYYNYSWSRPDLFDHPYCGQPANTGPGNQGLCTNHRWHVLDDVPFTSSLAFSMELWHHRIKPGLAYARIAYLYTRPGAIDDHRRAQRSELVIPHLPIQEPEATYGAQGATFFHADEAALEVSGGSLELDATWPTAGQGFLLTWTAQPGQRLSIPFTVAEAGERRVSLVATHRPDGGSARVLLDGEPLEVQDLGGAELGERGSDVLVLRSRHARRLLSAGFEPRELQAGEHVLTLECTEPGPIGLDYIWVR